MSGRHLWRSLIFDWGFWDSPFTGPRYLERLQNANVKISMDGRGRACDNIFTERLWRSVKYEEVYLHDYASPKEAGQNLSRYIQFYNHQHPHQALGYQTMAQEYGTGLPHIPAIHASRQTLINQSTLI